MFNLNVTWRDIVNGEPVKVKRCALALAAKHHFLSKIFKFQTVGYAGLCFTFAKRLDIWFNLSKEAKDFIKAFDNRRPVSPAKFKLGKIHILPTAHS